MNASRYLSLGPPSALLRRRWQSREELVDYQTRRLRRLLAHAYRAVPYYRKLFDSVGLNPREIHGLADLARVPVSSKDDLRQSAVEDVVAKGVNSKRLIERWTSGSSGSPFTIRRTWLEERVLNAFRLRAMRYFGLRPTDRTVRIDVVRPQHPNDHPFLRRLLDYMRLYRLEYLSCLDTPEEIVDALVRRRPDVIESLSGVLARISQSRSEQIHCIPGVRFIVVLGEVLTAQMREQIRRAFGVPVFDTYACHEFHLLAWQCKGTGELHVCDDSVILEVLKDGRPAEPGERGEVVVTSLHAFAMPFIRYRLGDIVTRGEELCACGQPFSTIRAVQGRMIDYFILPDGRQLHPYDLVLELVPSARWIRQYQLLQERKDRIVFRVVPWNEPAPGELARLTELARPLLGSAVEFETVLVTEISPEKYGKFRVSRSVVYSHYDNLRWDGEQPEESSTR